MSTSFFDQVFRRPSINNNSISINQQQLTADAIEEYYQKYNNNTYAIRVLLFNEDTRGTRSVIFDSLNIKNVSSSTTQSQQSPSITSNTTPSPSNSNTINNNSSLNSLNSSTLPSTLNTTKLNYDMLKRMVFGSVPLIVSNANAMKVHSIRSSNKIMISNVFNYIYRPQSTCTHNNDQQSQSHQQPMKHNKNGYATHYHGLNDMNKINEKINSSDNDENDSQIVNAKTSIRNKPSHPVPIVQQQLSTKTTTSSIASSANSNRSISPSSSMPTYGSSDYGAYKRLMRSVSSSLVSNSSSLAIASNYDENNLNDTLNKSFNESTTPANCNNNVNNTPSLSLNTNNTIPFVGCKKCMRTSCRKCKIGLSVIFTLSDTDVLSRENFIEFFFSHLPIIECQVKELRSYLIDLLPLLFIQLKTSLNSPISATTTTTSSKTTTTNTISNDSNRKLPPNGVTVTSLNIDTSSNPQTNVFTKINRAIEKFRSRFDCLFNSPRLSKPAWLTIINNKKQENDNKKQNTYLCNRLVNDLLYLTKNLNQNPYQNNNTKSNSTNINFFNTIISTVLKYNLSWVNTVLPHELSHQVKNVNLRKRKAHWTDILEKTNPYNPLWAQLGDLHGAVGAYPIILTRTVIIGNNKELIARVLFVLSYFIRCSISSYYDVKLEEYDFNKLKLNKSSSSSSEPQQASSSSSSCSTTMNTQLSINDTSVFDDQREVNIFDLNSSPVFHNSLNIHSPPLIIETKQENHHHHHSDTKINVLNQQSTTHNNYLSSPVSCNNKILVDSVSDFHKKMDLLINSHDEQSSHQIINDNTDDIKLKQHVDVDLLNTKSAINSDLNEQLNNNFLFRSDSNNSNKINTKKRHISSNSQGENCNAQELPLIDLKIEPDLAKSTRLQDNFGYSLLGGYCDKFVFDYVLHGTSDKTFLNTLHQSLKFSKQNSILDSPIDEAIYIVADLDTYEVRVYSSETSTPKIEKNVQVIDSIIKSVYDLHSLIPNSDFLLLHLEDKLQELYTRSLALHTLQSQESKILNKTKIKELLNLDDNDYQLLSNIINTIIQPNNIIISNEINNIGDTATNNATAINT